MNISWKCREPIFFFFGFFFLEQALWILSQLENFSQSWLHSQAPLSNQHHRTECPTCSSQSPCSAPPPTPRGDQDRSFGSQDIESIFNVQIHTLTYPGTCVLHNKAQIYLGTLRIQTSRDTNSCQ